MSPTKMGLLLALVATLFLSEPEFLGVSNIAAAVADPAVNSTPRAYWGVYIDNVPFNLGPLDTFENNAQKKVSIVHWGQAWMVNGTLQSFQSAPLDAVRAHGAIPLLDWGSWQLGGGPNQARFRNRKIYNGAYDAYIRQWAIAAKQWGHPFFLRFDWEMNGWWFPWGEGKANGTIVNGNSAGDYAKLWQHVHKIFASVGAKNVTWVWCPNIMSKSKNYPPLSQVYPGGGYVNWSCLDGYNDYPNWMSFQVLFTGQGQIWLRNSYKAVVGVAPNKPMLIAETASLEAGDGGALKGQWLQSMLLNQIPTAFPKINAIIYHNSDDGDPAKTYPIETSALSIAGFATGIHSPYYAPNNFSNLNTSPIPALH